MPLNFNFEVKEEKVETKVAQSNLVELGKKIRAALEIKTNLEIELEESNSSGITQTVSKFWNFRKVCEATEVILEKK